MAHADTTVPEANQDDLILAQQRSIEKEIAATTPLIGPLEDVSCLLTEYDNDSVYRDKILALSRKFSGMRRTRPDGNCFYRAFAFSYFETLVDDRDEFNRFFKLAQQSKDDLIELGFVKFTLEDFHETFMEVLKRIGSCDANSGAVESIFCDQSLSDYVVVYMRLLTSAHMQRNADFFMNFVADYSSVQEFCRLEVEPMFKDCDHVHVTCLSGAARVPLYVEYVDRDARAASIGHEFRPEGVTGPCRVTLLYRPGHYDLLYTNRSI